MAVMTVECLDKKRKWTNRGAFGGAFIIIMRYFCCAVSTFKTSVIAIPISIL